ncbi:MAG: NAD(P)-dependent oxidoreductase [Betaproteobacteria bacterium]|nr:NAD(P)-dependent oxidoreductase [Betaproteobacteria bacterium]
MTTLIIGAGLVGSQIARILVEGGETPVLMDQSAQPQALSQIVALDKVTLVAGDVLRPFVLTRIIREHAITRIVHMAAFPMLTLGAQRDPFAAIELNIMGTVNVLEAARIHGVKRVVVASSNVLNHFLSGGEGKGDPRHEEAYPRPTTFYASTKQAMESLGLNYATWTSVEFGAMRYGAVLGPWGGKGGGGPSNVVRDALLNVLGGKEAIVPANGLEWVYSKDAAMGTVLALRAAALGSGVFNITMGYVCPPEELSDAIKAAVPGARVRIEVPQADAVALPQMKAGSDPGLSRDILGFAPKYPMREAVAELADWIRKNPAP